MSHAGIKSKKDFVKPKVKFRDLGLIDYKECWDYQEKLFHENTSIKIANRNAPQEQEQQTTHHHLLFCEHPHVFTLGKSGVPAHLLINEEQLKNNNASYYKINRGGDITYHGPGQLVGYPILDLELFFTDIHKYLRFLEEAIILTIKDYGLKGERINGLTGVWLDVENPSRARKICAIGVRSSRWVTMHGFAFNVNTDLSFFNKIVPCGIPDKTVTSLEKELGIKIDMEKIKEKVKENFTALFGCEMI